MVRKVYSIQYPPKQMMVRDFMNKYVPVDRRFMFRRLMIQWDGNMNVGGAFYDMDVLTMKLKECQE